MNQIDEAFIQAYASPQQPANAPGAGEVPVVPPQPPLAGLHGGPHIQLPPAPSQQAHNPPSTWTPEPLPAPHFHVPSDYQAASVAPPHPTAETFAPVEPSPERRPLSTFSAPVQPATTAFTPVFEVDAFRWPQLTGDLLAAHHQLLIPVIEQLLEVSEQGRSLVGIAGTRPNVGCSTILLCLARLLASAGKSVALVDANFSKASLARDLGLDFDIGWESVLTGELPLAECVVKSLEDKMALLPLVKQSSSAHQLLASIQTSVTAGVLRYHYDLVLFNLGAAVQPPQDEAASSIIQHCRLDASIIIADTMPTGIAPMDPLLSLLGKTCLGVIGNSTAA